MKIPFCKISLGVEEKKAVCDVIDSGWTVMGKITEQFEKAFAEYIGAKHAIFVDSCTSALFLALKCLKIEKEKVCLPSLTFVATAEAVVNSGNKPVFIDVDKNFCMKQPNPLEIGFIPKYNLPVHLMGNLCDVPASIYDAAHRICKNDVKNSEALWCYSFYATKNMTTVQGGMIATNDDDAAAWLRKARDHGISHGTLERYQGKSWEYEVEFVGYRVKGDDLRAAIGLVQLEKLPAMDAKRAIIIERYNNALGLKRTGLHIYPVLVDKRPAFVDLLRSRGIQVSVHFLPLHKMPAFEGFPRGDMTNTEYYGERLVSLPLYPDMTTEEVNYVIEAVEDTKLLLHE